MTQAEQQVETLGGRCSVLLCSSVYYQATHVIFGGCFENTLWEKRRLLRQLLVTSFQFWQFAKPIHFFRNLNNNTLSLVLSHPETSVLTIGVAVTQDSSDLLYISLQLYHKGKEMLGASPVWTCPQKSSTQKQRNAGKLPNSTHISKCFYWYISSISPVLYMMQIYFTDSLMQFFCEFNQWHPWLL